MHSKLETISNFSLNVFKAKLLPQSLYIFNFKLLFFFKYGFYDIQFVKKERNLIFLNSFIQLYNHESFFNFFLNFPFITRKI